MATPPDELFNKQERELLLFADTRANQLLKYLEQARREMLATIAEPDTFTAGRVNRIVAQIDDIRAQLNKDILDTGGASNPLATLAKAHLEESTSIITGRSIVLSFDRLNLDVLRKFSENELIHVSKLAEAQIQTVKSVLFTKVGVKGQNPAQVARQLVGQDSAFAKQYGHIDNIMRTETSQIYNAQSLEGIKTVNEKYDLSLNKKIRETMDSKRNHPISQLLNGMVQSVDKQFRVSKIAVEVQAARLKKSSGGVLWPIIEGYYVGERLPAHYRERGITGPTDEVVNIQ